MCVCGFIYVCTYVCMYVCSFVCVCMYEYTGFPKINAKTGKSSKFNADCSNTLFSSTIRSLQFQFTLIRLCINWIFSIYESLQHVIIQYLLLLSMQYYNPLTQTQCSTGRPPRPIAFPKSPTLKHLRHRKVLSTSASRHATARSD
jgi:hypothetical protein